jgi:hypothetical protein
MFMLTEETSVCSCLTSSSLISSGIGSKGRSNEFKYFKIRCHFVGDLLDVMIAEVTFTTFKEGAQEISKQSRVPRRT